MLEYSRLPNCLWRGGIDADRIGLSRGDGNGYPRPASQWSDRLPASRETMETMAGEIFALSKLVSTARSRQAVGPDDLPESEFIALDILSKEQPLTIGEIQRRIGVVPAQMSRIVRALENREGGAYIECRINATDRRRVDVSLTEAGERAHEAYRESRLSSMLQILSGLEPDDRIQFIRILRIISKNIQALLDAGDGA